MARPKLAEHERTAQISRVVIDASIAIKWMVEEEGTARALSVRSSYDKLLAPDLLVSECANVLWKKVTRGELTAPEAQMAARLLAASDIELIGTRAHLEAATRLAVRLNHPAYDCTYMALAMAQGCPFVTADAAFVGKVRAGGEPAEAGTVLLLGAEA
jgi:predicted nucleic acid-binding protein